MSNSLAVAAVTATLRNLIISGTGINDVTARPLDNARRSVTGNQVNLFLYQVLPDAAWRNRDMPRQSKPNETGHPPLPLTLYYLMTAYSDDEDDTNAHRLLGQAMSVLHDHPLLGTDEIKNATTPIPELSESNLHQQLERVRITLQPLTFEEMSKLWTTFQTHYRVSAAYQVSVVLIESTRVARTPLPVLRRGEDDRGVIAQPNLIPPYPALNLIRLPERRLSAQPGDMLTVDGSLLTGGIAQLSSLRFDNPPQPVTVPLSDAQLQVTLPNNVAAGFYTISIKLNTPKGEITSNELPLAVAPVISTVLPRTIPRIGGQAPIDLDCAVAVLPEQRVSLLLGDHETLAEARSAATQSLRFVLRQLGNGEFPVPTGVPLLARLRVDGVDSECIAPRQPNEPENAPLKFDDNKRITIS